METFVCVITSSCTPGLPPELKLSAKVFGLEYKVHSVHQELVVYGVRYNGSLFAGRRLGAGLANG